MYNYSNSAELVVKTVYETNEIEAWLPLLIVSDLATIIYHFYLFEHLLLQHV